MDLAVVLLIVMGNIGAIDGLYFHIYKIRLYRRRSARAENVTHWIRGGTYAFSMLVLLHHRPAGAWYWIMAGIFAVELIDNIVDVVIEPDSRARLGGLPRAEYLVHMVMMALSGGVWVAFLAGAWGLQAEATALSPRTPLDLPAWLRLDGLVLGWGALALAALEIALTVRAHRNGDVNRPLPAPDTGGTAVHQDGRTRENLERQSGGPAL